MKQYVLIGILLVIFMAAFSLPAKADDAQSSPPPTVSASKTTSGADAAKKKDQEDRDRKAKLAAEIKARREAERRQRRERGGHENSTGGVVIITSPSGGGDDGGGGGGSTSPASGDYYEAPRRQISAGILFAPAQNGKTASFGVQWLGPKKLGAVAWISGNLGYGDDVIDAAIPHDDYWLDDSKGTYALEGICGLGSDNAMLILGAGMAVTQTQHTAVSNVTGWKWKAGSDSAVKPTAHASLRIRLADRVNMQFGYDTTQYAFFGLSGSF